MNICIYTYIWCNVYHEDDDDDDDDDDYDIDDDDAIIRQDMSLLLGIV